MKLISYLTQKNKKKKEKQQNLDDLKQEVDMVSRFFVLIIVYVRLICFFCFKSNFQDDHKISMEELCARFKTNVDKGLTQSQAKTVLERDG